jgi:uncharacterized membrane protein
VKRREDLGTPRRGRRLPSVHYDPEAFGDFSEGIARYFGTARYLVIQTVIVILWIAINVARGEDGFDPYPFILLNLAFSTQAAYAAPLILLAQNRQESRDRATADRDRETNSRIQSDTEFLARELSSVRLALADVVTNEDLDDRIDRLTRAIEHLTERLDEQAPPGRRG